MKSVTLFLSLLLIVSFAYAKYDDTTIQDPQADISVPPDNPTTNELDEFGPLHDPELIIQWNEGPQNHMMGIAWDGEYYWTINGGNISGLLNYYDADGDSVGTTNIGIDGRGIVYNPQTELLYISSYTGNVYQIDDPMTGAYSMLHSGIMQNGQASLGMSWDGSLLYDHYSGTVEVHDFFSGNLIDTMTGFGYGAGNYGGECAIIADTDYLYTWDTNSNTLYVYDLEGNSIDSYTLPFGDNGMSLSMANYMVFVSEDSDYNIGTWYGYELREWTEGPVQFTITPQTTEVPPGGGAVVYDVTIISELDLTYPGLRYWTEVALPNGQMYGPLMNVQWTHTPFMDVTITGITQNIPMFAPAGMYTHYSHIGFAVGVPALSGDFDFEKLGTGSDMIGFSPDDWQSGGFSITADDMPAATHTVPSQFSLQDAYPNPFNSATTVSVALPDQAELTMSVFNTNGQRVATIASGQYNAGMHTFSFNADKLASGVYFITAKAAGQVQTQKIVLMR